MEQDSCSRREWNSLTCLGWSRGSISRRKIRVSSLGPARWLTCLIFVITLVVTVQNAIVLKNRDNTLFTSQLKYRYNDATRIFKEKDGFQMAIAINDASDLSLSAAEGFLEIEVFNKISKVQIIMMLFKILSKSHYIYTNVPLMNLV